MAQAVTSSTNADLRVQGADKPPFASKREAVEYLNEVMRGRGTHTMLEGIRRLRSSNVALWPDADQFVTAQHL